MTRPIALRPLRHLVLAVPALASSLAACEGCRSPSAAHPAARADDGPPTVRLYLMSDLAGALEPCGCTKDQLGGLDHFGAWVKHRAKSESFSAIASAGPLFFMDTHLAGDRADQDRIKAETIARVLKGLGFSAFAPGVNDWDDGAEGLARLSAATGAVPIEADGKAVVKEMGGVKIGFVGFGQTAEPAGGKPGAQPAVGLPQANVQDVVRRGVNDAKAQGAQVLIALAAVGRGEAKRIADAIPELTAVLVGSAQSEGDANTRAPQGERVGDVLIAQSSNHLQTVAVLDLFVRQPLVPGQLVHFADATGLDLAAKREELSRRIDDLHVKLAAWERDPKIAPADVDARRRELADLETQKDRLGAKPPPAQGSYFRYSVDEIRTSLGKDQAVEADLLAYYKAVDEHNRVAFADRVPVAPAAGEASYVGIDVCATCHPGPRDVWQKTSHAGAYAALSSQFKEYNLECVSCHVTGYERPGGSTVTHVERLENVQCEVCHGPGSRHVASPADPSLIVGKPSPTLCPSCHHPPHVEQFDPSVKMKEILGPGHGRPAGS